jgi:sulfite reductase (NADPH) hemoprotein beta-component
MLEIERVMGVPFEEVRPFTFASIGDTLGWQETPDGRFHGTALIENGRRGGIVREVTEGRLFND